ncbi:MAG TPA: glutamate 5-kinase [Actinomycetota bacterium]|nr:glutamate 5-kinase [Actinomycetota bacterium]
MTRPHLVAGDRLVVKIGTASLVGGDGDPDEERLATIADGIAHARAAGIEVVLVSSGAIAAGLRPLGLDHRPSDIPSLQAAAAVGQGRLLQRYSSLLADRGLVCAQMLLTQHDFMHRQQYLNARNTLDRLLALGAVPVVNENDTVATDEIRFGDNDRLAALVANLGRARLLALLTDTRGLHAEDPRRNPNAPVIEEVDRITPELERMAGGRGSDVSTGGMASKLAAAWVATFSGVGVVVASAEVSLDRLIAGDVVGTYFHPHPIRASARRLWIAFAQPPQGTVVVDAGARRAMVHDNRSLLAVGVTRVEGEFASGATVDVMERDSREVFARGLVRYDAQDLAAARGKPTVELAGREVIHRDQLVILES